MPSAATSARQQSPADAWWEECQAAAAARGRGEDSILPVGAVEPENEEGEPTLDDFRQVVVVICPAPVEKLFDGILRELWVAGCDEDDDPDGGFRMTNTSSSYGGQEAVGKHLRKVEALLRKSDYPGAFTHLLATLVAAKRDDYWFTDTDVPEEVEKLLTTFDRLWAKVLARTDGELGGVTAADREAVEAARQALREGIEEYCLME
ncbi:glycine betaine ABC transporter substrate-binding [Chlorella sorokiniana]|uniref:Glycine betaine ABC transporter substrate-binding n=1 Tax=Chlorella sorokiniana TaxID=3076 RepID=A0A2P6TFV4_CHLSO|nr:glycine betaine ABC transporter substrate-binding [Chlorella sorokiniana]|eukprot:PRW32993.1 glycine betaine ABC transporter substrate-binding [Chlorella sorokiniana]